jgi:RHS repeat-associated protein
MSGSGTTSYFTDALGSTVALSDASGSTAAEFTYEPYGKNTKTGSGDTPFRYTGRDDDGTGLYYYRARYYHPQFARFAAEDPIGLDGGINLYAYVGGNPTGFIDPLGLRNVDPSNADGVPGGSGPWTNQYHGQGGEGSPAAAMATVVATIVGVPVAIGVVVATVPVAAGQVAAAAANTVVRRVAWEFARAAIEANIASPDLSKTEPPDLDPKQAIERTRDQSGVPKRPSKLFPRIPPLICR